MALILHGASECPICGEVIGHNDDIVATPHFIADSDDPLWEFSDAAMHKRCFLGWELRGTFVSRFNTESGSITWGNGTRHQMQPDGSILSLSKKRLGD
jgi:hypothetical protein